MSSAPRPARCSRLFSSCAGQSRFGAARDRLALEAHARRRRTPGSAPAAGTPRRRAGRSSLRTSTICGITSPARCTTHGVADAHVLALDLVLVVERGAGDGDAADVHRARASPPASARRCGRPAPRSPRTVVRRLGGRELERHRPARRARHDAELGLEIEAVHLDDAAVDLDRQPRRGAPAAPRAPRSPRRRRGRAAALR